MKPEQKGNSRDIPRFRSVVLPEERNNSSTILPEARKYLKESLPKRWYEYFAARRAGRSFGLRIICPKCGLKPPQEIEQWNRWRWLSTHVVLCQKELHRIGE